VPGELEYVTIEKEQGAEGLVLGRRGDLSIHGQVGESCCIFAVEGI